MEEKICFKFLNELFLVVLNSYSDYLERKKEKSIEYFMSMTGSITANINDSNRFCENFFKCKNQIIEMYINTDNCSNATVEEMIKMFLDVKQLFEETKKRLGPDFDIKFKDEEHLDTFFYLLNRVYEEIKRENNLLKLKAIDFEFNLKRRGFFSRLFS